MDPEVGKLDFRQKAILVVPDAASLLETKRARAKQKKAAVALREIMPQSLSFHS
jgi:hypothetical protein